MADLPKDSIFFEAHKTSIRKEEQYILENDVLLISSHKLFTADKISFDKKSKTLGLEGHVIGLISGTLIFAKKAKVNLRDNLFLLEEGRIVSGDLEKIKSLKKDLLNFSEETSSIRQKKQDYLRTLEERKNKLYLRVEKNILSEEEKELVLDEYESLLKKESALAVKPTIKKSTRDQKRNIIWEKINQDESHDFIPSVLKKAYFKIDGSSIKKLARDTYEAIDSSLSFCDCDEGESPAWALKSSRMYYKSGDYASLHNPVLEIKGIPLFYLPYIRVPLVSEKKIGILSPKFNVSDESGFTYSQDFYIPIQGSSDLTIGYHYLEKRGLKLKASYETVFSNFSFFHTSVESIRDKKWLEEKNERSALFDLYTTGLASAYSSSSSAPDLSFEGDKEVYSRDWWKSKEFKSCSFSDTDYEACLNDRIKEHLASPGNSQRGKITWKGQYRANENFSFVSEGSLLSDHRYGQDLEKSFGLSLFGASLNSRALKLNGFLNKITWGTEYFWASVSSKISDPLEWRELFQGYQMPFILDFRSRYYALFNFKIPQVYLRFAYRLRKINQFYEDKIGETKLNFASLKLGEGLLADANLDISIPLAFRQVFSLKYSFELEGKHIFNEYGLALLNNKTSSFDSSLLGYKSSYLGRLKTGIGFSLPLEGFFSIKEEGYRRDALKEERVEVGVRHRMSWNLGFHYFSQPIIKGAYGKVFKDYRLDLPKNEWLRNNSSDFPLLYTNSDTSFLIPQKKLGFSTFHSFSYLKRRSFKKYNNLKKIDLSGVSSAFRKRATKELFSKREAAQTFLASSPAREEFFDSTEFLSFSLETSYDFEKLIKRKDELSYISSAKGPIEPWSPLVSNLSFKFQSFHLKTESIFNFYLGSFRELTLDSSLGLPFGFVFSSGISLQKILLDPFSYDIDKTRNLLKYTFNLGFSFIENSHFNYHFEIHKFDDEINSYFSKSINLHFDAPSRCWGGVFSWALPLASKNPYGSYYISFFIKFVDRRFELGNLASYFQKD